jgi:hypothetical protein
MMRRALLIWMLAFRVATAVEAFAQQRRALVIGADKYQHLPELEKGVGDARAMEAALEPLGFEVDLVLDPDRRAFNGAVSAFTQKLRPGDVALVHFSGHGVAMDGENYLLPSDVPQPATTDKERWNLVALLCRLRYEQTMNNSVPIRPPALSLRRMVPLTGRSAERTRANTFWPNEPKHIVSEPMPDTLQRYICSAVPFPSCNHFRHFAQTKPTGKDIMETTIQHERDNLRVLTTEYSRIRTQTAAMQRSLAAVAGRNALSALFKLTHRY